MVFASALCGYVFTKQEMWHRKLWFRLIVIMMYLNAGLIPWYLNMAMLGLTNNFLAYILPGIVAPYNLTLSKHTWNPFRLNWKKVRSWMAQVTGHGLRKLFFRSANRFLLPLLSLVR